MLKKKGIISKHKKNLDILKNHNKNYYIDDKPKISDAEYDKIKLAALAFESKYPYLKKIESINDMLGQAYNKFKN